MGKDSKSNPFYCIILPDISTRHFNKALVRDTKSPDYKSYIENVKQLVDFLRLKNVPNCFGINRSLLDQINENKVENEIITPISSTEYLLIYDNIFFSRIGHNAADISGICKRKGKKFIKINDIPKYFREESKAAKAPLYVSSEAHLHYCLIREMHEQYGNSMLKNLTKNIEVQGFNEIRIVGERLWYIGGMTFDGPAHHFTGNIAFHVSFITKKTTLQARIIKGCTFPTTLEPYDKESAKFFGKGDSFEKRTEEYGKKLSKAQKNMTERPTRWLVDEVFEEGIDLKDILAGK